MKYFEVVGSRDRDGSLFTLSILLARTRWLDSSIVIMC